MPKKKKSLRKPKPRNVWQINPKSRVKKNKKTYSRPEQKKLLRRISDKIGWFGER